MFPEITMVQVTTRLRAALVRFPASACGGIAVEVTGRRSVVTSVYFGFFQNIKKASYS